MYCVTPLDRSQLLSYSAAVIRIDSCVRSLKESLSFIISTLHLLTHKEAAHA